MEAGSKRIERRLAAILAADVAGYSRLVEQDEVGTLQALSACRAVMDRLIAEHGGRIANTAGDSVLAEFPSAVDAVECAVAVQGRLTEQTGPSHLRFRIGIHVGDVVPRGADLLGEGVNVAARLEGLADPGGICISAAAHEHVRKALPLSFADLGPQTLKNIEEPVRAWAVLMSASKVPSAPRRRPPQTISDKPTIAVLPFTNLSADPEQVYFSDGVTDDVITELSRFRELMVIARNSSFAFRGKSMDVREIGRALGAAYVLEGNVRRAGSRVRITAQLVDAANGGHLWAERYDRGVEDVFALQEEIATSIVTTVARRVFDAGEVSARRRPPQSVRAYDLFLQGMRIDDTFTPEAQARVESLYEQARAIDPTFARAYTGLAFVHVNRSYDVVAGVQSEPNEHELSALRLAEEALALDPNDPRVHSTLGFMCSNVRDFERAERHLDLARALNPNDAVIQFLWARLQVLRGHPERGIAAVELACRLHPCHPPWYNSVLGQLHFQLGEYGKAAMLLEKRMWNVPARYLRDLGWRVAACGHQGRLDEAVPVGEELVREISVHWRGPPDAKPLDYVDWLIWYSHLEREADREHLRAGLRAAGLPA